MLKLIIPIIIVTTIIGGGFYLYKNLQTKPINQTSPSPQSISTPSRLIENPTASPVTKSDPCDVLAKGSSDVPPLYKEDVTWEKAQVTEYDVPLGEEGSRKMSGCLIKSQNITDQKGRDVRIFYSSKMAELKWNPLTSADGIYSSIESYRKDSKYFVIQQNLAPSVTSSTQNPLVVIEVFYSQ